MWFYISIARSHRGGARGGRNGGGRNATQAAARPRVATDWLTAAVADAAMEAADAGMRAAQQRAAEEKAEAMRAAAEAEQALRFSVGGAAAPGTRTRKRSGGAPSGGRALLGGTVSVGGDSSAPWASNRQGAGPPSLEVGSRVWAKDGFGMWGSATVLAVKGGAPAELCDEQELKLALLLSTLRPEASGVALAAKFKRLASGEAPSRPTTACVRFFLFSSKHDVAVPVGCGRLRPFEAWADVEGRLRPAWSATGHNWLGVRVARRFHPAGRSVVKCYGTVTSWVPADETERDPPLWRVEHDDGDKEDLEDEDVRAGIELFQKEGSAKRGRAEASERPSKAVRTAEAAEKERAAEAAKAAAAAAAAAAADAPSHHVRIASGPHMYRSGIVASQKKGWTTVLLEPRWCWVRGFMEEVRVPTKDVVWPSAAREPPNQAAAAAAAEQGDRGGGGGGHRGGARGGRNGGGRSHASRRATPCRDRLAQGPLRRRLRRRRGGASHFGGRGQQQQQQQQCYWGTGRWQQQQRQG